MPIRDGRSLYDVRDEFLQDLVRQFAKFVHTYIGCCNKERLNQLGRGKATRGKRTGHSARPQAE